MKRLHVALAVDNLEQSIQFYSTLFNTGPSARKPDYAKWMLDDPKVNFSISARGGKTGVDHLGIQVDDDSELGEVSQRLEQAGQSLFKQEATTCCYARSNKAWVRDPQGVAWETFHTFDTSDVYGENVAVTDPVATAATKQACCAK